MKNLIDEFSSQYIDLRNVFTQYKYSCTEKILKYPLKMFSTNVYFSHAQLSSAIYARYIKIANMRSMRSHNDRTTISLTHVRSRR